MGRMELRPSMARRKPPTSPMTFSGGTFTPSRTSSPVSTPRTPILWSVRPTATPGQVRSTMNAVTESCARLAGSPDLANTVYQSASRTPDIQHLVPVRTQPPAPSGSGRARVRMPITSLPAWGSDRPNPARWRPSAMPGRYRAFCSSEPRRSSPDSVGRRVSNSMSAAVFEYLATSSMATVRPWMPAPDPPCSSGMHSPRSPASRKTSNRSAGYSPLPSIWRARGFTLSCANRRTLCWSAASSGERSKSMAVEATRRFRRHPGAASSRGRPLEGRHRKAIAESETGTKPSSGRLATLAVDPPPLPFGGPSPDPLLRFPRCGQGDTRDRSRAPGTSRRPPWPPRPPHRSPGRRPRGRCPGMQPACASWRSSARSLNSLPRGAQAQSETGGRPTAWTR